MIRLTRSIYSSWSAVSVSKQITRGFNSTSSALKNQRNSDAVIPEGVSEVKVTKRVIKRQSLTPFQRYCVDGGIERPYTGDIWYEKAPGTYNCVQCDSELFR